MLIAAAQPARANQWALMLETVTPAVVHRRAVGCDGQRVQPIGSLGQPEGRCTAMASAADSPPNWLVGRTNRLLLVQKWRDNRPGWMALEG